ncbi:50S ribosomal protein P1 [Halobacteriales archaeon QS_4_62_28]|nr:MAG: 50S ribosomal protein P1 [Halobacteriales archaeon QS_4_62_28]
MEYVYAALILNESGEEINEENLTDVLEAAGVDVEESRVKALVAALEDVDIDEAVDEAAGAPVAAGGPATAPAESGVEEEEPAGDDEAAEEDPAEEEPAGDDEDDEADGEGLGELFG